MKFGGEAVLTFVGQSLPVRGAWIEIAGSVAAFCRLTSLPVRGAWIEIFRAQALLDLKPSLPVRGAWIEIWAQLHHLVVADRRSPCGERGLK